MKRPLPVLIPMMFALLMLPITAWSAVQEKTIHYQDGKVALRGTLAWDDAISDPRPGVLVVHEWWGINDYARKRARMLAEAGYVAMAVDMYGQGQSTQHGATAKAWMKQITRHVAAWRRRALAGLAQLQADPHVDPSRLAAIGYCFGGATVMQLAYDPQSALKGVVSFHGSLPALPHPKPGLVKPAVLAYHGNADPFVSPKRIRAFQKALDKAKADWRFVGFDGARHSFTNPEADKSGLKGLGYHPEADRRSWTGMLEFFERIFK